MPVPGAVLGAVACSALALASAASIVLLGYWALALPLYAAFALAAVAFPERFAVFFLALAIGIEPGAIDFTRPLSLMLYDLPPGVTLPITITPFEVLLTLTAVSMAFRPHRTRDLAPKFPVILYAMPCVVLLGVAYGTYKGGPLHLAYHEARGLLFGTAAFFIATRMANRPGTAALRSVFAGTAVLGAIVVARYVFYLRDGSGPSSDIAFAHEDAIFLSFGAVLGTALLFTTTSIPPRILLIGYNLLMLAAIVSSGRRAATLGLIVGVIALGWFLVRKRPGQVLALGVPALILGAVYLGVYWNHSYGATAQPARAIRSQIDPSARDQSSDVYRDVERYDVEQTIRYSRVFGVGFGRPFAQFQPLPYLGDFWPLQSYTPHQNILWLWLKMGVLGVSVYLATWVIAFRRCVVNFAGAPARTVPLLPMLLGCGLLMYIAYAKVDLAFIGARSAAPLAVLLALAFQLPSRMRGEEAKP
jgi:hypothetical protein